MVAPIKNYRNIDLKLFIDEATRFFLMTLNKILDLHTFQGEEKQRKMQARKEKWKSKRRIAIHIKIVDASHRTLGTGGSCLCMRRWLPIRWSQFK